jgi:1-pyrroline-5-carboxylate dehydrogenase
MFAPPAARSYPAANEPVLEYRPGAPERRALRLELERQSGERREIPLVIGGKRIRTAERAEVTAPHATNHVLASVSQADGSHAAAAVEAAVAAHRDWSRWPQEDRAAVFLRAADLLAGPWRQRLNAATMLGQSKTVHQAEIDSACELIDFLRLNVAFAAGIGEQQPFSAPGTRNILDYRPLEGFVYAVTPFNFTAIGGNLPTAPALLGNTVVWKPAATAALSNYLFLELLEEAGLPPGVINFLPGDPAAISAAVLADPRLAGVHFTGSTAVFDRLWQQVAANLPGYRSYPRLVGETGGKDFVLAHPSADLDALAAGLVRGAFEYQGQKCSAASRAYVPRSRWPALRDRLAALIAEIKVGDVAAFDTFMGAVIDRAAFDRIRGYLDRLAGDPAARIVAAGGTGELAGHFIPPTLVEADDPRHQLMTEEIFGPVLTVHAYDDRAWPEVLDLVDGTSPYGLTGAVFAEDRAAIAEARDRLRYSAGNFYINDKPTGAVVGQQPFGGSRRSGTNDKAGSPLNLLRWLSPRTIKETYVPPRAYGYPSMAPSTPHEA